MEIFTVYLPLLLQVVGLFAAISAVTPNTWDNQVMQMISNTINVLGLNVGYAKNAP
jgi:hypothetical protein